MNLLQTEVEDSSTGLLIRTTAVENKVTALEGQVSTISSDLNDASTGLKPRVQSLELSVNGDGTSTNPGLITEVAELKQAVSGVYTYKGNITGANSTGIVVEGIGTVPFTELDNGWVYNIKPVAPATSIEIKGKKYNAGMNVAWSSTLNDFDELGSNIDVDEIHDIENRVTVIENYFKSESVITGHTWTSANLPTGMYQFSAVIRVGVSKILSVFILAIESGTSMTSSPINISGNFDDYWEIDSASMKLQTKPAAVSQGFTLNIHKIGDI